MGIGIKLAKLIEANNTNPNELANKIGVAPTTIYSIIKRDSKKADIEVLLKIADIFGVTAEYFVYDNPSTSSPKSTDNSNEFSVSEVEHIKKYRLLDDIGKERINYDLKMELKRSSTAAVQADRIAELESVLRQPQSNIRIYTYMRKIAAAGNGFYFDDIPTDTIEAPYMDGADFIIGVSGDSMEPDYSDGDLVYVQKRQIIETGDIGIFMVNGECYIKEAGEEGLVSLNPKYKLIPGSSDIQCIGKVLGKVVDE